VPLAALPATGKNEKRFVWLFVDKASGTSTKSLGGASWKNSSGSCTITFHSSSSGSDQNWLRRLDDRWSLTAEHFPSISAVEQRSAGGYA